MRRSRFRQIKNNSFVKSRLISGERQPPFPFSFLAEEELKIFHRNGAQRFSRGFDEVFKESGFLLLKFQNFLFYGIFHDQLDAVDRAGLADPV